MRYSASTLTRNQQDARDVFYQHQYVAVCAPRQSGKTSFLKHLVEDNPAYNILVVAPTYFIANNYLREFKNITPMQIDSFKDRVSVSCALIGYSFIIGDEVYIPPRPGVKRACAFSLYNYGNNKMILPQQGIMYWGKAKIVNRVKPLVWKNITV